MCLRTGTTGGLLRALCKIWIFYECISRWIFLRAEWAAYSYKNIHKVNTHFTDLKTFIRKTFLFLFWLYLCRSRWPRSLKLMPVASRLLGLRVRIPLEPWLSVSCACCVLLIRDCCLGLIPCPWESHRLCMCVCVCVCDWVWSGMTVTLCTYNE